MAVVHVKNPAVYCAMLLLHGSAELGVDTEDGSETGVATGPGFALIQRCKRMLLSSTVRFADYELVREGWVV